MNKAESKKVEVKVEELKAVNGGVTIPVPTTPTIPPIQVPVIRPGGINHW